MTIEQWLTALDERHLADLTLSEVTRALRALSSCYVERRDKLATGGALDGAGKRAAFALFYGPQHFVITREIVRELLGPVAERGSRTGLVVDLGCGTGTAGAAAALETGASAVEGFDVNPWAAREANWTYRSLGLRGRATVANLARVKLQAGPGDLLLAAYTINELPEHVRGQVLERLLQARDRGADILVIEPIGRKVNRWWDSWARAFVAAGGREDEWRFRVPLPPRQRALAKAAGLDVQALPARSLFARRQTASVS